MLDRIRKVAELRFRISIQMYLAIGGAVALTIAASFVGWISFNSVGEAQKRVTEESVPELGAAFRIAEYSGTLAAAAPRLTSSTTPDDLATVSAEIAVAQEGFEEQMRLLQQYTGDPTFEAIRTNAQTILFRLLFNINAIEGGMPELFELNDESEKLRLELIDLRTSLESLIVPEIDDQLFYLLTGYGQLGEPPVARVLHLSESEFNRYRHLAALRENTTLATQLLSSAFSVSNAALIEPLQESFESAEGRLRVSMAALGDLPISEGIQPILTRLFEMGTNEDDGFDLLISKHQLEDRQQSLLTENRNLSLELLGGVDGLVTVSEGKAAISNAASTQALQTGRTLLLVISGVGVLGALIIAWGFVGRVLLRRIGRLSERMRHMADGDLEGEVDVHGRDEVAEMAAALEVFRRHALEVQRLNLVEKLAEELGEKNSQLEDVLAELQRAQDQIVMREKLVALGEVTAGVAHEIRNPLNFVKNFSEASQELIEELEEIFEEAEGELSEDDQEYVEEVVQDLTDNLERIRNHSERANRIVHDMLMMGRGGGEWRTIDLNLLLNEHALLAYHSARATDPEFQLDLQRDLDPQMGEMDAIPQDLGRTFLNMVGNSCHATDKKRKGLLESGQIGDYAPVVRLKTRRKDDMAIVSIYDNGSGIPQDLKDKIFNPFFTTKPTDEGTGLGLALSSDIVRQHGGSIRVESVDGEFTEMIIELPLTKPETAAGEGDGLLAIDDDDDDDYYYDDDDE
ncbi:MAG: ATP-binding protein [bacterium]|nr:ATP-binding protein [bacterium]MDE0289954.1 ATP-binding protein [bacterium]MDE0437894.1 ATP-binding protein [bacterium]